MNEVRVHGDPFGDDTHCQELRGLLRLCLGSGMRCALSVPLADLRPPRPGERQIDIDDGAGMVAIGTALLSAEIELIRRCMADAVSATAPVVVFAPADAAADRVLLAGLAWPRACKVLPARAQDQASALLARVRAELRWAGTEDPEHGVEEAELQRWLALPPPPSTATPVILHVTNGDPTDGSDVLLRVFATALAGTACALRVLLTDAPEGTEATMRATVAAAAPPGSDVLRRLQFVRGPLQPAVLRDCAIVAQPLRLLRDPDQLVLLLAAGRPLCVTRCRLTAPLLPGPGLCMPVGGRWVPPENDVPACCEPNPRSLGHALSRLLAEPAEAAAIAARARAHVRTELVVDRPAAPPRKRIDLRSPRPRVVLEAPFFEVSSSSELSIATAEALLARGNVDLQLVPVTPFRCELAALRARAPRLVPLLARTPADADLWLSSGWPVRTARPPCRLFAIRLDWEYGSLPLELSPTVTQECDRVVVHSALVFRTVMAAGRPQQEIVAVPHGVDGSVFHEAAPPLPEVLAFKGRRAAVLFVGGLVFRKGIDVLLKTLLAAQATAPPFCAVIKPVGGGSHYRGFHLRELVERAAATPGAPPILLLDRDMTRAELAGLYRSCDLLLHPYRGEGFGLPVLEARACGLPVLVTAGGATDDFCRGPGARQLPAQRRALELSAPHVAQPWLLEPDAAAAVVALVDALRERDSLRAEAQAVAAGLRQAYGWDAAAAAIEGLAFTALGRRRVPAPQPVLAG
jgi:glycosyltransferase involved in cell wall biosynthesis